MPAWDTGSPSRTRFLDFSGIPSLNLSCGAGTECLHPSWVQASVTLPKGMDPWGPAVRRPATIPSSPVLSSWGRAGSREGGSPSSSIWVAPRATASQRFAKRRRRFSAAAAPLRRPALTAPGRDSSLRPLPSGAGSEPAVLVPGRSSRACPAGSLTVSPATAKALAQEPVAQQPTRSRAALRARKPLRAS